MILCATGVPRSICNCCKPTSQNSLKGCYRSKGTEHYFKSLKHYTCDNHKTENGYEEGSFREAFSVFGIEADPEVYSKR